MSTIQAGPPNPPPLPPRPSFPSRPFSFRRWFRHFNPFYPISAACMFAGCFTMAQSMRLSPGNAERLLALIGTIAVYQVLLIALGLTLAKRWHAPRDARFLLLLMLLFAVDPMYLVGELTSSQSAYTAAGCALMGLAAASTMIGYALTQLKVRLSGWSLAMLMMQLLGVMGLPYAAMMLADHGDLSRGWAYVGWWLLAAMLAMQGRVIGEQRGSGRKRQIEPPMRWALATLPMAGLILRLAGASWVFHADYSPVFISPLLVGLSVWLPHARQHERSLALTMPWQFLLLFFAIFFSFGDSEGLKLAWAGWQVEPRHLTFVAMLMALAHAWWVYRRRIFGVLLVSLPILVIVGINIEAIGEACRQMVQWLNEHLLPRTAGQWGAFGVVIAFVMLGGGTLLSWRKQRRRTRALEESRAG